MADPILTYVSQSGSQISATYADFPAGSQVVVVNKISNAQLSGAAVALRNGGDAAIAITLPETTPSGTYFLKGLDASGGYLAQSVDFNVS